MRTILHLDLDDWLRGARDWRELWEFRDRLRNRAGSAYQAALLQDPEVVAALAAQEDDDSNTVPIEGFGPIEARLANIEDRLIQLIYAVARVDSTAAPTAARPQYPHIHLREHARREDLRDLERQLIPKRGDGDP
ncbi:hypothetical protein [Nocardia transvalensis]|uniref:hypothetical protein n=1 Tax=Nocardia transvalensis TaxID=37333 RepID=UPI0018958228|nr:hypothetical protein [Nocardia transvalensis]MBF6328730.1 hypothetical protein [Nocardia transvalensis]